MQAPYNDRWERKKRYLVRNFLVNPGFRLSPIPEEDRSSPDSGSLPDLVVEPVPDRHDHPPSFYEGLERRMKRYYRQLFLGMDGSEDDYSPDFEANRSMGSTFMLDVDNRKDNEANGGENRTDSDLEFSRTKKKDTIIFIENEGDANENTYEDNLFDTHGTYNESSYDVDNIPGNKVNLIEETETDYDLDLSRTKKRQFTKKDERDDDAIEDAGDKLIETRATYHESGTASADSRLSVNDAQLKSILSLLSSESDSSNESDIERNERDLNVSAYRNDYENENNRNQPETNEGRSFCDVRERESLDEERSEMIETKSDASTAPYHRLSTTVAEIHEIPKRASTQAFDNGSPVLIPRLLQFSRTVFGNSSRSFNVLEASGEFIRRLSHKDDKHDDVTEPETEVQRLLSASELTRASLDSNAEAVQIVETENMTPKDDNDYNIDDKPDDEVTDKTDTDLINRNLTELPSGHNDAGKKDTDPDNASDISGQEASIDWNKDGIDDDEDCLDNAIRRGVFARKARKMIQSSGEELDHMAPLAHSSEKSFDEDEDVDVMRDARVSEGNVSWHGQEDQRSPEPAFEAKTNADKIENEPSDSTEINASYEEEIDEMDENSDITPSTETDNLEEEEEDIGEIVKVPSNPHDGAIREEFWSVSSIEVDFGDLPEDRSHERTADSESDSRKKETSEKYRRKTSGSGSKMRKSDSTRESSKIKTSETESGNRTTSESESNKRKSNSENGSNKRRKHADSSGSNERKTSETGSDNRTTTESGPKKRKTLKSAPDKTKASDSGSDERIDTDEAPSKRLKRDIAIQTGCDVKEWEDIRKDFFVGSPMVFRLCRCQDHVCS